ncbi:hypothetical protein [Streptomyces sp. NPDC056491]|uniref:hypothetical protein n=1 Tax=Streptomyces sp. NPDC056491 TaxID=3345837 RepID=UPI0036C1F1A2
MPASGDRSQNIRATFHSGRLRNAGENRTDGRDTRRPVSLDEDSHWELLRRRRASTDWTAYLEARLTAPPR